MFGTITLKGHQKKGTFVSESGQMYKIDNFWVIPPKIFQGYVLLKKRDNEYWCLLRSIEISDD